MAKRKFAKEDIGGEILPILTTGLYRDAFDTLREYVQNAIDANGQHVEVIIDPDTITVSDDGEGMNFQQAQRAIRLGISDKNPRLNVGFRGIGIYSAYNLCDTLNLYTKSKDESPCYVIRMDFRRIRDSLLKEQESRKRGASPKLYLENLLENSVHVDIDEKQTLKKPGTRAIMSGVLGDVYQRVNNWDQVVSYLQDVIPLPFRPEFKYADLLRQKFKSEDYRTIPVVLQIGIRREDIYRPYKNEIFTHGGEHPPNFFNIGTDHRRFGFAWVCINDARQLIKDAKIRGLLIKKFGFSIAGRNYLEPYFMRTVFNRRITGELIVQDPELIPNAARSDFEHNSTRQAFFEALPKLIREISEWANKIQEADKATEIVGEVHSRIAEINESLAATRRDREKLLLLNVELHDLARQLRPHAKTLRQIHPRKFKQTDQLLKDCQKFVQTALVNQHKRRRELESEIVKSIQREGLKPTDEEKRRAAVFPNSVSALIESYDLAASDEFKKLLQFLDESVLQVQLSSEAYQEVLENLRSFLDDLI